jgi:hypothetical protein
VFRMHPGRPILEGDGGPAAWEGCRPEQASAIDAGMKIANAWIEIVNLLGELPSEQVESNEAKGPLAMPSIHGYILAAHETHVGVVRQRPARGSQASALDLGSGD